VQRKLYVGRRRQVAGSTFKQNGQLLRLTTAHTTVIQRLATAQTTA
jgi:hypothetical protein